MIDIALLEFGVELTLALLGRILDELYRHRQEKNSSVHPLEELESTLKTLEAYGRDAKTTRATEGMKNRTEAVQDLIYKIQDALDFFMADVPEHFHSTKITQGLHLLVGRSFREPAATERLRAKVENINEIRRRISEGDDFRILPSKSTLFPSTTSPALVHAEPDPFPTGSELVGIHKHLEGILRLVQEENQQLAVITVTGQAGVGKTSVISEVYQREMKNFDFHGWRRASEYLNNPHLGQKICGALGFPDQQGPDAARNAFSYLQNKRYLLVLDGISSEYEWNCIRKDFPANFLGSRIIISTRLPNVVFRWGNGPSHVYDLPTLEKVDAWDLFSHKAFRNHTCPEHLYELSSQMASRCEGIPHAIVAVANLLSNRSPTVQQFQEFRDRLDSELRDNDGSLYTDKVAQRYELLPGQLKYCFLYFCMLPDNIPVERGKLFRLWLSEGLVEQEETVDSHLAKLAQMSFIHITKRDSKGKIRSCHVHSLVRPFILSNSEAAEFSTDLSKPGGRSSSKKYRRLALHNSCLNPLTGDDFSLVRTLLAYGANPAAEAMDSCLLSRFQLLKVLDLEGSCLDAFPEGVTKSVLLRYLCLRKTKIATVPKSIKNLCYLETLDLRETNVTVLPKQIGKLPRLLHLLVDKREENGARVGAEVSFRDGRRKTLQKLSLIKASVKRNKVKEIVSANDGCIVKELGFLQHLRKLGITELRREDGKDFCASIEQMRSLSCLHVAASEDESLDLGYVQQPPPRLRHVRIEGLCNRAPEWLSSLKYLEKLELKRCRMANNPLALLQDLPSLMELRLTDTYTGGALQFRAHWFKELRTLEIKQFYRLQFIDFLPGTLPRLQKLELTSCYSLRSVPGGIQHLKLQKLHMDGMNENFLARIRDRTGEARRMLVHIPNVVCPQLQKKSSSKC